MGNPEREKLFINMVGKYERVIYKVCSFYITDENPLKDLYQEVVCNLWKGYDKFRHESSESTWIYRVALNTCITGMRKEMRKPQNIPISEREINFLEPDDMQENIKEMYRLIYRLKNLDRAIILLYLEEKSYQEIAEITGLSVSNVGTKLKRIKQQLKEMSKR